MMAQALVESRSGEMRATIRDVWSPGEHPLRGDRLEVVVGVVRELVSLGDVRTSEDVPAHKDK